MSYTNKAYSNSFSSRFIPISRFGADVSHTISQINKDLIEYKIANLPRPGNKLFDLVFPGDIVLFTNSLFCIDFKHNIHKVEKLYVIEVDATKKTVTTQPMFEGGSKVVFEMNTFGYFYEKNCYSKSEYYHGRLHLLNDLMEEIYRRKNTPKLPIISADNTRKNMMPGAYFGGGL